MSTFPELIHGTWLLSPAGYRYKCTYILLQHVPQHERKHVSICSLPHTRIEVSFRGVVRPCLTAHQASAHR